MLGYKMKKSSKVVSSLLIAIFCILALCTGYILIKRNQIDHVEQEHKRLTGEYGDFAVTLLEDYLSNWTDKEVDVIGVRVLEYSQYKSIKIIGCTREKGEIIYPNNTTHYDLQFSRIYVFWLESDAWEYKVFFNLEIDSPAYTFSQTFHEWEYLDKNIKEIIGELPEIKHWECLYFLEESGGY
jgi:hypothetical protein